MDKKTWSAPKLEIHGDVQTITLINGYVLPTDTKNGKPGEAFPLS